MFLGSALLHHASVIMMCNSLLCGAGVFIIFILLPVTRFDIVAILCRSCISNNTRHLVVTIVTVDAVSIRKEDAMLFPGTTEDAMLFPVTIGDAVLFPVDRRCISTNRRRYIVSSNNRRLCCYCCFL